MNSNRHRKSRLEHDGGHARVEDDLHRLGVARLAVVGVVVLRVVEVAAGVANLGLHHAGDLVQRHLQRRGVGDHRPGMAIKVWLQ